MEHRKKWTQDDINYKYGTRRYMQVDVTDDGQLADTVRNRMHDAFRRKEGRPVSIRDIAKLLGLTRTAVAKKLQGTRRWNDDERQKIERYTKDNTIF